MTRPSIVIHLLLLSVTAALPSLRASEPEPTVDFPRDVFPLLRRACFECHGPDRQEGDLRIDGRAALFASGTIVPGQPDRSELLRRLALPAGDPEVMPARGEPFSPKQVDLVRRWIREGAKWPEDFTVETHWAYRKPVSPALPAVADRTWVSNEIDLFIAARLEREKLSPSRDADRATLIRRVSLDLTGLPPTPEEVDAFLADTSAGAYERLVDRLLASPDYGVRWARPWLDAARYADSYGFQRDDLWQLWAYRDWVIRALNDDMPFDRFTIEQIAGDLLPEATESQRIATGFHRCAPVNVEAGSEPEESRTVQIFDRVNTTATIWLGTTFECAQCHDHKYDPFSQADYYRLMAFFNHTEIEADRTNPKVPSSIQFRGPTMPLGDEVRDARRRTVDQQLRKVRRELDALRQTLSGDLDGWVLPWLGDLEAQSRAVPESVVPVLRKGAEQWNKKDRDLLIEQRLETDANGRKLAAAAKRLEAELARLAPDTTLVMRELAEPRTTRILERGNYLTPGDEVTPGTPAVLHPLPEGPANRLTLARWLVSRDNPLAARVTVNRLWAELFGRGLVETPEDFGLKGEPPTHPELLDWLAVEFMERGWSTKHLLRLIVTSATYRQSSHVTPERLARDDANRLYARAPRFRLDAETIRDNALAIAGLLSHKQEGPPIKPYQPEGTWAKVGGQRYDYQVSAVPDRHRRGLYIVWKRGAPYPSFINFDATSRLACTVKRSRTNTPLQALTLLNDPVYVETAEALARRILAETGGRDLDESLRRAFRLCTARLPDEVELDALRDLYSAQLAVASTAPESAGAVSKADGSSPAEFEAWFSVATALLNLDETITRE